MFFDPNEQFEESSREWRELENGDYDVVVSKSMWKPSKSGNMMMEIDFTVVAGERQSASIRHWLNLGSNSETAREIARKDLSKICVAVDLQKPITTEDELVAFFQWMEQKQKMLTITVKQKPDRTEQLRARVVAFNKRGAAPTPKPEPQPVALPPKGGDDIPF